MKTIGKLAKELDINVETVRFYERKGRGRNGHYWPPPAQIRTCATNASGSYLGYLAKNRCSG
ncbi:MerR family DNA-binding transcriptional regulator [Proteus mirabilis]|uniref:MerR family DNA-binding transcriptional regulator n=1 Tax=Proteus mirabilis TaxID=584 RepID=UPI0033150999